MKKISLILSSMILLTVLTSCASRQCCYSTNYGWQQYVLQSKYGTCVKNHCECVCKACTFNEPACSACLSCMSYDGCGYNH